MANGSREPGCGGYIGRFAPSPTGPLHLGSLLTAAASFLHARQHGGRWLVRIEDIDPPRAQAGATDTILATLEALELHWDDRVERQLHRLAEFSAAAERLIDSGHAFRCRCSRRDILKVDPSGRYPGTCRNLGLDISDTAIRARAPTQPLTVDDGIQGTREVDIRATSGDFVIRRRDGLPAYHLAAVIDDARSGITDVVRGIDLLDETAPHLHLQSLLDLPRPRYWHLPVVVDTTGQKLSKRTGATGVDPAADMSAVAYSVLCLLGLDVPAELVGAKPGQLWGWAAEAWRIERHAGQTAISLDRRCW